MWQGKCWRMKNQGQPKQYIRNVKCLMFADRNTSLIQLVKMSLIFISLWIGESSGMGKQNYFWLASSVG